MCIFVSVFFHIFVSALCICLVCSAFVANKRTHYPTLYNCLDRVRSRRYNGTSPSVTSPSVVFVRVHSVTHELLTLPAEAVLKDSTTWLNLRIKHISTHICSHHRKWKLRKPFPSNLCNYCTAKVSCQNVRKTLPH